MIRRIFSVIVLSALLGAGASLAEPAAGDTSTLMYVGKRLAADGKTADVIIFIDLNNSSKTTAFNVKDFTEIDDANIQNLLKLILALPHRQPGENSAGAFHEVDSRLILSIPALRPELNTQSWRIEEVSLKPLKVPTQP